MFVTSPIQIQGCYVIRVFYQGSLVVAAKVSALTHEIPSLFEAQHRILDSLALRVGGPVNTRADG